VVWIDAPTVVWIILGLVFISLKGSRAMLLPSFITAYTSGGRKHQDPKKPHGSISVLGFRKAKNDIANICVLEE
jgi:hypothetical protein